MCDTKIDITMDTCPFTFVKTKLLMERMTVGQTACVRLQGAEALRNVPKSVHDEGASVLSLEPEVDEPPDGIHLLVFRKMS